MEFQEFPGIPWKSRKSRKSRKSSSLFFPKTTIVPPNPRNSVNIARAEIHTPYAKIVTNDVVYIKMDFLWTDCFSYNSDKFFLLIWVCINW
jgi:hypothetical protein